MTTINSDTYAAQVAGTSRMVSAGGFSKTVHRAFCTGTLPSTLAAADIVNLFKLPKGAKIVDAWINCSRVDTNGSPTLLWDVGDADSATTIFSSSTVGRSATASSNYDRNPLIAAIDKQYTVDTLIFATVNTVAATKAAGTFYASCLYTIDGYATS